MTLKVIVHEVEEGRYWAEVPAIPGCATQGDTFEELNGSFSLQRFILNPPDRLASKHSGSIIYARVSPNQRPQLRCVRSADSNPFVVLQRGDEPSSFFSPFDSKIRRRTFRVQWFSMNGGMNRQETEKLFSRRRNGGE